jgi:hypothetical protein
MLCTCSSGKAFAQVWNVPSNAAQDVTEKAAAYETTEAAKGGNGTKAYNKSLECSNGPICNNGTGTILNRRVL